MKQVTTLILVSVVLAVFLGFVLGSPALVLLPADTDTQSYCVGNTRGGGQFPDPDTPTDRSKYGELANEEILYLSWSMDGTSSPLTVAGTWEGCALSLDHWVDASYQFQINDEPAVQDDFPEGGITIRTSLFSGGLEQNLLARTIRIDGISYFTLDQKEKSIRKSVV